MEEGRLKQVFALHSADGFMDSLSWKRLCKCTRLLDELKCSVLSDIVLAKVTYKGLRKLDLGEFIRAVKLVAEQVNISFEAFTNSICLNAETVPRVRRPSSSIEVDNERHGILDLSKICDRSKCNSRGLNISRPPSPGFSTHADFVYRNRKDKVMNQVQEFSHPLRRPSCSSQGPERFFYDKSTYTGVCKNRLLLRKQQSSSPTSSSGPVNETNNENALLLSQEKQVTLDAPIEEIHRPIPPTPHKGLLLLQSSSMQTRPFLGPVSSFNSIPLPRPPCTPSSVAFVNQGQQLPLLPISIWKRTTNNN